MLVRVGASPLHLEETCVFTVGRSNTSDLTIPSQRVSRQHAEIFHKNAGYVLRDLGSQNGTLVNGKRIRGERRLSDGDEIEFGPYLCTFREGGARGLDVSDSNAMTQPMVGDAMAGRLDQINLVELLQTLEFNKKSGTLEVFGSDGEGSVVLKDGAPKFAEHGQLQGEEAIYVLIGFTDGQFSFSPEIETQDENVTRGMGSILMEACRRIDEPAEADSQDDSDEASQDDLSQTDAVDRSEADTTEIDTTEIDTLEADSTEVEAAPPPGGTVVDAWSDAPEPDTPDEPDPA